MILAVCRFESSGMSLMKFMPVSDLLFIKGWDTLKSTGFQAFWGMEMGESKVSDCPQSHKYQKIGPNQNLFLENLGEFF